MPCYPWLLLDDPVKDVHAQAWRRSPVWRVARDRLEETGEDQMLGEHDAFGLPRFGGKRKTIANRISVW